MTWTHKLAVKFTYLFEVLGVCWAPFGTGLDAVPVAKKRSHHRAM